MCILPHLPAAFSLSLLPFLPFPPTLLFFLPFFPHSLHPSLLPPHSKTSSAQSEGDYHLLPHPTPAALVPRQ